LSQAAFYNLNIDQGATFRLSMKWETGTGTVVTPVNLTGITFTMMVRRRYANKEGSTPPILSLTSAAATSLGSITITNAATGALQVTITDEGTVLLTQTEYVYDLEAHHPDGSVTRLLNGRVLVSPEVTTDA